MATAFLIKYAEIGLKGKNRDIFEKRLVDDMYHALRKIESKHKVIRPKGRVFVEFEEDINELEVVEKLQKVFGITSISPILVAEDEGFDTLKKDVVEYLKSEDLSNYSTFKVNARRSKKSYPLNSMEINAEIGGVILDNFSNLSVDVHKPELLINIEVRDKISVYIKEYPGLSGLPKNSAAPATVLLSGGIDSPVAAFMMAKRGCPVNAVYFHAPPYTSERAKQKVVDLAKIVSEYSGEIRLYSVNFTDIQMAIYEKCPHEELTIIMRRYMMKIAEQFAIKEGSLGLVTGESLGQVASQTMQSLFATDDATTLPVYRPLIGLDKLEIIERAQKIGTYDTSILPFEDCCTVFVAKHPVTKPRLDKIKKSEEKLSDIIDDMLQKAIDEVQLIVVDES